jgi:diguanylate cyclase (GGDEF)-like protein
MTLSEGDQPFYGPRLPDEIYEEAVRGTGLDRNHPAIGFVAMAIFRERIALQALEDARRESAEKDALKFDGLTRLLLRGPMTAKANDRLTQMRNAHRRSEANAAIAALIDVVDFKELNSLKGQTGGDEGLVAVAGFLEEVTREEDLVSRWGGDEFTLFMPFNNREITPLEFNELIHRRLRKVPVDRDFPYQIRWNTAFCDPWVPFEATIGEAEIRGGHEDLATYSRFNPYALVK